MGAKASSSDVPTNDKAQPANDKDISANNNDIAKTGYSTNVVMFLLFGLVGIIGVVALNKNRISSSSKRSYKNR